MPGNPYKIKMPTIDKAWVYGENSGKSKRPIDKNLRMTVWKKYFGLKFEGKCYVCKRTIHIDHFQVGHNKARAKGGKDNISNLRPICGPCNRSMGTISIENYKKKYFAKPKKKTTTKKKLIKKKKPKSKYDIDVDFDKFL